MPGFGDIIGHEKIIAHLQTAIRINRVSHAYILDGPDQSGKNMLADAFAMTLQCEQHGEDACLHCRSCHQALTGNQPDIIHVEHEKPKTISVNDIRNEINRDIDVRPYSSRYKIYIVDEAEKMNVQAQNALLKTLEEPPSYAVILLLTNNAQIFLPTIRSRCMTLSLKAVDNEKIRGFLMKQKQIPDYLADVCTAFAQGNVGRALDLAGSRHFTDLKDLTVGQMKSIANEKDYELADEVEKLGEFESETSDYLSLIRIWFRDVLVCKAAGDRGSLIFSDQEQEIGRQAGRISYRGIQKILDGIETAERRIRSNVNRSLTLELLLLTIRENMA